MRLKALSILLALWGLSGLAQTRTEATDSTTVTQLEDVVVEAARVIRKADKNIYLVDEDVKKRSTSTMSLLNNLQIPQLTVNDVMETVSSSLGSVQIRINGREADTNQLKAINPENVQRIEWIDNPGLRYGSSTGAVINIIVKNPTVGGSLTLTSMESLTMLFNNTYGNLILNHGRSQWTLGGWGSFRGNMDIYQEYTDSYKLPDGTVVSREQDPLPGEFKQNMAGPYFSYNYVRPDTTNFYIGLHYMISPGSLTKLNGIMTTRIDDVLQEQLLLTDMSNNRNHTPGLGIYLEQKLKRNQTLVFNGYIQYNRGSNTREYLQYNEEAQEAVVDITNNIKSRNWYHSFEGNYIKSWGERMQLTAGVKYTGSNNRSQYMDYDDVTVHQLQNSLYFFGEYLAKVRNITFTAGLGGKWSESHITDMDNRDTSLDFTPKLTVSWQPTPTSMLTASYSNSVVSPTLSQTSPVIQNIDGIQLEQGNPYLHSYMNHDISLRLSLYGIKRLTLSALAKYSQSVNPIQLYYTGYEGNYIMRSYANDGFHKNVYVSLSASWDAIPGWLSMSADLNYSHQWNKGKNFAHKLNAFGQSVTLSAYHWNFMLDVQLYNPAKSLGGETVTRGERFNLVSLSYRWRHWNFAVAMFQPFSRYSQTTEILSDLVRQKTVIRSRKIEHLPFVRVTYNLNWGYQKQAAQRKINDSGESISTQAAGR